MDNDDVRTGGLPRVVRERAEVARVEAPADLDVAQHGCKVSGGVCGIDPRRHRAQVLSDVSRCLRMVDAWNSDGGDGGDGVLGCGVEAGTPPSAAQRDIAVWPARGEGVEHGVPGGGE